MSIDKDRKRLAQKHNLEWIGRNWKAAEMVTVYRWLPRKGYIDYFILSALIPLDQTEEVLSERNISSGDPENMDGMPGAYPPFGESKVKYFRWGSAGDRYGAEPLVICREFSKITENYIEISEEFRLFHNLYHDRKTDTYIKIDDAGTQKKVIIVKPNEVLIRLQEIRQFLAIKEMYLSLLFEFNEYSKYSLEELEPSEFKQYDFRRKGAMCWTYDRWNIPVQNFQSISRLRGRKLIEPLPKSKSGFGDFAEEPRYVEFIVDIDDNGDEVCYTCNPYKLKTVSGKNPEAPWDFIPVHFRKQVLDKYYSEPSKYTVKDSRVECGMWGMKIDNHDSDKVCVMLRDLSSLPYTEQLHWRAYNILPEGGVSETFYRRMVLGEWTNSDQPEHLFKQNYEQFQKVCDERLDWQLLKPLAPGDAYRLQRLRIPVNDEQCHFDDLVQDLQMILIESINVKGLKRLLPEAEKVSLKDKRSIEVLEEVLSFHSVEDTNRRISFLQKLQTLRSKGSGHRKGDDYQKIANYFGVDSLGQQEAFVGILKQALDTIEFFTFVVHSGKLSDKSGKVE